MSIVARVRPGTSAVLVSPGGDDPLNRTLPVDLGMPESQLAAVFQLESPLPFVQSGVVPTNVQPLFGGVPESTQSVAAWPVGDAVDCLMIARETDCPAGASSVQFAAAEAWSEIRFAAGPAPPAIANEPPAATV